MKRKMIKYGSIAAAAIAVLGIITWMVLKPETVECIALENSILENTFNEVGEVVPLFESDVYAKYGGKLLEVNAVEGSSVYEGELLFVFDESDLKSQDEGILGEISVIDTQVSSQITALETQRSSLETERAGLLIESGLSRKEEEQKLDLYESSKQLYESGGLSAQGLKIAQLEYEAAVNSREFTETRLANLASQLSTVNAQLNDLRAGQNSDLNIEGIKQQSLAQKAALERRRELLRENQSEIDIFASQEGVVRDLSVKKGQIIPPGSKLCSVYQPLLYKVECYVLVENTEGVKVGDEVEVTVRLREEDRILQGSVTRLAQDAVDILSKVGLLEKRVKVEIALDAGYESVGPYWPVEIRFISAKAKDCLIAPKTALFEDGDNIWKVLAVREGKVTEIVVEKGVQTPSQVELKGELRPGDVIVKNVKTSKVTGGQSVKAVTAQL
jgi:multidrug resistance efflux pump